MRRIGIIGAGRMGLPIAGRLAAAGYQVTVHDLRAEPARAAHGSAVRWVADPAAAAAGCEVLITVLPGAAEVAAVFDQRLLEAVPADAVWIDHSSCAPDAAAPVRDRVSARGVACLEAPMGGGPDDAARGTLRLFVGGDAALLDRLTPLLRVYASPPENIVHTGGPGTGYLVKLLVNQLWFSHAVATAEALLLGARLGVDPVLLRSVLSSSAASSAFVRDHLGALFQGDYLPSYSLARIHEQLAALTALADTHGVPHAVASAVESLHADALAEFGPVDGELLALALMERRAGRALRPGAPTRNAFPPVHPT